MEDSCEKLPALDVANSASAYFPGPSASAEDAFSCILGIRWTKELIKSASPHRVSGMIRRGPANPTASQPASRPRAGFYEVWSGTGRDVDVDSAGWQTFTERKARMEAAAARNGRDSTATQPKVRPIRGPEDPHEAGWGFMKDLIRSARHRQPALKLWLAATAKEPMASDMRRRELAAAQPNPQSAFEIADTIAGSQRLPQ